ncbi:hypothetical protein CF54_09390 [Streptomyces sp. Tu 6176]|nr:hypothetical protein CF54_09390 [Streptomyces sp. Tu 6176]
MTAQRAARATPGTKARMSRAVRRERDFELVRRDARVRRAMLLDEGRPDGRSFLIRATTRAY